MRGNPQRPNLAFAQSAPSRRQNGETARRPDDQHAEHGGAEAEPAQPAGLEARNFGHTLAHGLGEARHQQALDRKHQSDRDGEITHARQVPSLRGADGAGVDGAGVGAGVGGVGVEK